MGTLYITHKQRAFGFKVAFQLHHPQFITLSDQKLPACFHLYKNEYTQK